MSEYDTLFADSGANIEKNYPPCKFLNLYGGYESFRYSHSMVAGGFEDMS